MLQGKLLPLALYNQSISHKISVRRHNNFKDCNLECRFATNNKVPFCPELNIANYLLHTFSMSILFQSDDGCMETASLLHGGTMSYIIIITYKSYVFDMTKLVE